MRLEPKNQIEGRELVAVLNPPIPVEGGTPKSRLGIVLDQMSKKEGYIGSSKITAGKLGKLDSYIANSAVKTDGKTLMCVFQLLTNGKVDFLTSVSYVGNEIPSKFKEDTMVFLTSIKPAK